MTPSISSPQSTFFSRNEVKLWTGAAVLSLALCLISLGVIVAAAGTSPHWYYQMTFTVRPDGVVECLPCSSNSIPFQIANASEIQNALQYGAQVGGVALAPCVIGGILFVCAMLARRRAMEKSLLTTPSEVALPKSKTEIMVEVWAERGHSICLILGLTIATFSVGLMIGSSIILNNGVSHVDALITQGMHDYPHLHAFTDDGWVGKNNFWDQLKSDWLDPTRQIMSGIVPVSVVGALGGSALTVFGVFGKGAFNLSTTIYNKLRSHTSENDKMTSKEENIS